MVLIVIERVQHEQVTRGNKRVVDVTDKISATIEVLNFDTKPVIFQNARDFDGISAALPRRLIK